MNYDFNKIIDRRNTDSDKWNSVRSKNNPYKLEKTLIYRNDEVIPMWLADMDFESAPEIYKAIKNRIDHRIFGYAGISESYYDSVSNWMKKRHNWLVDKSWICPILGDLTFLSLIIKTFTEINDAVLVQTPAYNAFLSSVEDCNRRLIKNALLYDNKQNRYSIDYDQFENIIKKNNVKLFILCSPHTPIGRVWNKEELLKIAEICIKNDVLVLSDEVHCDIVYSWSKFIPFGSLEHEITNNLIVCTNPTKAFNLAAFPITNLIIKNQKLKAKLMAEAGISGLKSVGTFAPIVTETAYNRCDGYLNALLKYLEENVSLVCDYVKANIPKLKAIKPDGTYLLWIDFSESIEDINSLRDKLRNECKLIFEDGKLFGDEGVGFQRINIALPRSILHSALERLKFYFK